MEELKAQCEMLIDSCISPLALRLTDQELTELREKLETEVCSYLTCDRYWSPTPAVRNQISVGVLLLTTITITLLYLMFIYHLVWVWH